ncbi:MAG: phosphatase PAP2 family protein [Lachnospiraceae bacterium]|nr:phosphatase PAP2 family protein [Lachnospiraceae bacterium]
MDVLEKIKKLLCKYSHAWTLLYFFVYMTWFMWLEKTVTPDSAYTNIHVKIDDMIPFCEWFIIPYLLWFVYVVVVVAFVFFTSRKEFYQASAYLFIGMSICLLICTVWPNGQDLRIEEFTNDNILTSLMSMVYHADTNTNVFPSIHVYNSVAVVVMLCKSHKLKNVTWVKIAAGILSILIILSTMFLKQHSVVDAIGGIVLAVVMYIPVYGIDWTNMRAKKSANQIVTDGDKSHML